MKRKVVVGAHYGLTSWLLQRLTAVIIVLYLVVLGVRIGMMPSVDYFSWLDVFYPLWFRVTTFVMFLALCFHAWVGVRDIIMDYIKPLAWRVTLQSIVVLLLLSYLFWVFMILQGV